MDRVQELFFNWDILVESRGLLWDGFQNTLKIVTLVITVALTVGVPVAWARMDKRRLVRYTSAGLVDITRAIPPLVILVFVYFVVPSLIGLNLTTLTATVITLGLLHGVYVGEVYRGGFLALERGQIEAGRSLGLRPVKLARLVVVPQMLRVTLPGLANQITQIVRDSSLAYVIGYPELMTRALDLQNVLGNATPLMGAAVTYIVLLLMVSSLAGFLERRNREILGP